MNCAVTGTFVPLEKINQLEPNMTQKEVIDFIGRSDRVAYTNSTYIWKYFNIRKNTRDVDKYMYYLLFTPN